MIETAVIEYMKEHPKTTQIEIAEYVGKSRRTVQNAIASLKEKGIVEREGVRMRGQWVVKENFEERKD